jgi:hypothetical protein
MGREEEERERGTGKDRWAVEGEKKKKGVRE